MILINPKGKEVEFSEEKGKRFLKLKAKIKQGWKKKAEPKPKKVVKKTESKKK